VPVIVHGYDYPTPRNAPARFLTVRVLGPWLQRAYDEMGIDAAVRVPLTDFLVDVLAEAIKVMAMGPTALPQVYFVETRHSLERAAVGSTGTSGDWLNEIHPSHEGYRKIAARISATLTDLLTS
jgi:lysophospholipase L1-like esterase